MESDNPDIQWALELLRPDPTIEQNFLSKYFTYIPSVFIGTGTACYINYTRGLPKFARPHLHALHVGSLLLLSTLAENWYIKSSARRDAVLRDYIIRHPEDFPPPERKKYAEVFDEFVPIR